MVLRKNIWEALITFHRVGYKELQKTITACLHLTEIIKLIFRILFIAVLWDNYIPYNEKSF